MFCMQHVFILAMECMTSQKRFRKLMILKHLRFALAKLPLTSLTIFRVDVIFVIA